MQAEFQASNPYATFGRTVVAQAQPSERVAFIRKTYIHLAAAIYAFVAISWFALTALPPDRWLANAAGIPMFGLIMLGMFIFVNFIANKWAHSDTSVGLQYAGLGLCVLALMVLIASGWVLYDTSNVMHDYRTDQHVAASLALFASIALLFWYILQIVMSFANRD